MSEDKRKGLFGRLFGGKDEPPAVPEVVNDIADAAALPEAVPETAPDAAMKKEDCKKLEGASDDCPAQ